MQTIITKYHSATTNRDARISVRNSSSTKRMFFPYDYSLEATDNHIKAAKYLLKMFRWDGDWIGGQTENGMVFVSTSTTVKININDK